ncbi:MAG: M28 family peptidase [Bacteroidales bacterium]|nr:M28 family peptidase [Bacteroidales bacterium]
MMKHVLAITLLASLLCSAQAHSQTFHNSFLSPDSYSSIARLSAAISSPLFIAAAYNTASTCYTAASDTLTSETAASDLLTSYTASTFPLYSVCYPDTPLSSISQYRARQCITTLASKEAAGRATGTDGIAYARSYIIDRYLQAGIKPWNCTDAYAHGFYFYTKGGMKLLGANVIGYIPSRSGSKEWIVIGAHYDHLGTIGDKIYYGADDNASGIAALLELANAFGSAYKRSILPEKNILFIAIDGKEFNRAGSLEFVRNGGINPGNISLMINIDQIGSILAPPGKSKDYMLILGREKVDSTVVRKINYLNTAYGLNIDLDYTFYGSKSFYKIFSGLSDQRSFSDYHIPSLLFTSGITENTYKTTDTEETITYSAMIARTQLIYLLIYSLVK